MLFLYIKYRGSNYRVASGNSFFKSIFDKGNYGEFLTFTYLENLSGHNKLMTNLYLPKEDGSTTEVEVYPICWTHRKFSIIKTKGCVHICQTGRDLLPNIKRRLSV